MKPTDWYIEGPEFSNCNCDFACPCQFESPRPTHGHCRGFAALRIDRGYFGEVPLDGLCGAVLYAWPGPIYEGNGEFLGVIDERADGRQRDALATVLYGGETNEGATHWWVYRMMSTTVHPPIFRPFEFDVNIERRTARIVIPDVLESTARPIRSPATGAEHHVRIQLPNGIEFDTAEIGSGTTKATVVPVRLDLKETYGHFTLLRHSRNGVVRSQ